LIFIKLPDMADSLCPRGDSWSEAILIRNMINSYNQIGKQMMAQELQKGKSNNSPGILNDAQLRALSSALITFEISLRKIMRSLLNLEDNGILYKYQSHIESQHCLLIQTKVSKALKLLADLANRLGIESKEQSIEGLIRAEMSLSWESLEGCRSSRFQGYGNLNPKAVKIIDTAIDRMAGLALEIGGLADNETINFQAIGNYHPGDQDPSYHFSGDLDQSRNADSGKSRSI